MALVAVVTVAADKTPIKWGRFIVAASPLLIIPAILGAGYLTLPHDWYGVPVVVYLGLMMLWGAVIKHKTVKAAASEVESLCADQYGTSLEMMAALVKAVDADQESHKIPRLVRLVQAKMTAESMVDRMRKGSTDVKPD